MRVAVVAGPGPRTRLSRARAVPAVPGRGRFADAADRHRMAGHRPFGRGGRGRTRRPGPHRTRRRHRRTARRFTSAPRGWRCSMCRVLRDSTPDVVVSDVITACGGLAAELMGDAVDRAQPRAVVPAVEGTAADGQRAGARCRDPRQAARLVMRALTARSWREGLRQRSAVRVEIGLPAADPGPLRRLVATLPALEVPRPDWPDEAVVVGPLHFEPTETVLEIPPGDGPVVVVAPSTASHRRARSGRGGAGGAAAGGGAARGRAGGGVAAWADPTSTCRRGRWSASVARTNCCRHADLVICGGGHGMVSKTLMAGVPMVVVPGGGDQWEIANRLVRQGSAQLIRPLEPAALAAAVTEVLSSPRYAEAARRAGATVAGRGRSGTGVPRRAGAVSVGWIACG